MNGMRLSLYLGVVFCAWAQGAPAAEVVSNAMSGAKYSNLASAVAAAADGSQLVMIGDETLAATLVISNRVLSLVSDGAVRTVRGSTNCAGRMIYLVGTNATLTLGRTNGSDAAPTLIFDGGKTSGVASLSNMFYSDLGWLTMHPGVVLRNLASVDTGAINNSLGVVEIFGGRIENNSAPYGGGIYNKMGEVWMSGGSITGNLANIGGGIYNQAVYITGGYIAGYVGKVDVSGGAIADNVANNAGGGIFNMGSLELSGGRVERNAAPTGGGVLHYNGAVYGMVLRGSAVVAGNSATTGRGIYYNNDANTWLTIVEGGRVEPSNDVFMAANNNPIVLSGHLSGRGGAAQITPPTYSTNQYVLGTAAASNQWIVSNYYGKFSVTPESGGGQAWYMGEDGRLTHVNPASLPMEISEVEFGEPGLELGVDPGYMAWDGTLDFATSVVSRAWNFQPLSTNAYAVTNGRVVIAPDAPAGIFRMRRE